MVSVAGMCAFYDQSNNSSAIRNFTIHILKMLTILKLKSYQKCDLEGLNSQIWPDYIRLENLRSKYLFEI